MKKFYILIGNDAQYIIKWGRGSKIQNSVFNML